MPLVAILTIFIGVIWWKLSWVLIGASVLKAVSVTIEILLIVFGALWLLSIMKASRAMHSLQTLLRHISKDIRVQVLLIAWLFEALVEGAAGFGTPAALAAPLLIAVGFTPMQAVVLALIGNSTPVTFGAVGTPIVYGLGSLGFTGLETITAHAALLHAIVGTFIPLVLIFLVARYKQDMKLFWSFIPFALFAGIAFTVPSYVAAVLFGPALPSLIGGGIGLLLVGIAGHYRFLLPKEVEAEEHVYERVGWKQEFLALLPYILLITGLVASRWFGFGKHFSFGWTYEVVTHTFTPLFAPYFYLILVAIISVFLLRAPWIKTLREATRSLWKPGVALLFTLVLVQVFVISSFNPEHLPSMPQVVAQELTVVGSAYPIVSPVIGMFGSFITGSNTVSNLLFAPFQVAAGQAVGLAEPVVLALQSVGGAVGNMIAIHNILAVCAVVGLVGREGSIIRKTVWVALGYAILVGVIGLWI